MRHFRRFLRDENIGFVLKSRTVAGPLPDEGGNRAPSPLADRLDTERAHGQVQRCFHSAVVRFMKA